MNHQHPLLPEVTAAIERCSRLEHQLARRRLFLKDIAMHLRCGLSEAEASARIVKHVRRECGLDVEVLINSLREADAS